MNKIEKTICILLGLVLAWYIYSDMSKKSAAREDQTAGVVQTAGDVNQAAAKESAAKQGASEAIAAPSVQKTSEAKAAEAPRAPEKFVTLENGELKVVLTTRGAAVASAILKEYAQGHGAISETNPAVEFNFGETRLGAFAQPGTIAADADYVLVSSTSNEAVFASAALRRKVTLEDNYQIKFSDEFAATPEAGGKLCLGSIAMGSGKNDLLSIDSWSIDAKGGRVIHHCEGDSPLKSYLVGGIGGCSGSSDASMLPPQMKVGYQGSQKWVALKNRFFVTALVGSSAPNAGFDTVVARDMSSANYRPSSVSAEVIVNGGEKNRESVFYVGPKKQSVLWSLGMKDVMEFGMWRWICYPLVWVLNLFNSWIPSFGIAIILLTILVRIIFWPLTHKSTVGMKKMQEVQPLMKELQKKFKDNPQRLQQETWQLYREHKVNPMSSCLPMLIQIPVFIALFNVLRSAVELRYASFLWIADLSEPEGLFASWFPFGGLNILPILMALTMALQSALTPSAGDKQQQRMMMIFMPVMMLFMFYSFPAALSLYWTLSQVLSIVQMWMIRRQTAAKSEAVVPEVIDPPQTRQMRRHQG